MGYVRYRLQVVNCGLVYLVSYAGVALKGGGMFVDILARAFLNHTPKMSNKNADQNKKQKQNKTIKNKKKSKPNRRMNSMPRDAQWHDLGPPN